MGRNRVDLGSPTLNDAFEAIRADYNASKRTRFTRNRPGVGSAGYDADFHFRSPSQYYYAMELARDIDRNDIVVGQGVDRFVDNVVQTGFTLDVDTGDKSIDDENKAYWDAWSTSRTQCDLAWKHSFHAMERLVLRDAVVAGDIIPLPNESGSIEIVEAHRLKTPANTSRNVCYGVLLEENTGRHLEYWFTKRDVGCTGTVQKVSDVTRYPAWVNDDITGEPEPAVFHCLNARRFSQTRGFTAFAPITDTVGMHDDLQFAQLVKAQIQACYAILEDLPPTGMSSRDPSGLTTETTIDGTERTLVGMAPGQRIKSQPGGRITGFSPNVPNAEFFPHSLLTLTFIAINLGLPLFVLLLDPKQSGNFSAHRGVIEQAKTGYRKWQKWLTESWHSRVYRWKIRQRMAQEPALLAAYRRGIDVFGHRWNAPRWPYIQPMEDASANILRVRNGQASPRMVAAENGYEWQEIVNQTVADNSFAVIEAKKKAAEINSQFPDDKPVNWLDLLCLPTPDRVTISISGQAGEQQTTQQGATNAA